MRELNPRSNSRFGWVVLVSFAIVFVSGLAIWSGSAAHLVSSEPPAPADRPFPRPAGSERAGLVEYAVIPAFTPIRLELLQAVSSQDARLGDRVEAELAEPIRIGDEVVVLAGARVTGRVTEVHALRRVGGQAVLEVTFDRLEWRTGGTGIAARFRREGESETGTDSATIAAGATIGSILGNQTERSDRGRMIGAVIGAVAATVVASQTPGETVELRSGAQLLLRLDANAEMTLEAG